MGTQITKNQFDYGRQRGIEWIYYLAYGNVPHQFRQMHPEYRYVDQLGYSATVLYPTAPEARKWSEALYRDLIATYGTDHLYLDSPFVESTGATDPEGSFALKLSAAQQMCGEFKELDPPATWESDSWDFGALPQVWTSERIGRYYAALPREMMVVYDTAGLVNPYYKRTSYFHGTPWAFGILHSFQGDDHLHGDIVHALSTIQELSLDPLADKCIGIYHVPETSGHNVLFFDLTTQLAWQPGGVALDGFLHDYARRRYGSEDAERMLPAVRDVVDAVYRGEGQMPIYHKLGCRYGPSWWWPIVDEHKGDDDPRPAIAAAAQRLRVALRAAAACRGTRAGNTLCENDMVDWARTYLAHVFNWAVLGAYQAFGENDAEGVHRSAGLAGECLSHIEAILSTRPDFSLHVQIDRCTAVPGANPHLAEGSRSGPEGPPARPGSPTSSGPGLEGGARPAMEACSTAGPAGLLGRWSERRAQQGPEARDAAEGQEGAGPGPAAPPRQRQRREGLTRTTQQTRTSGPGDQAGAALCCREPAFPPTDGRTSKTRQDDLHPAVACAASGNWRFGSALPISPGRSAVAPPRNWRQARRGGRRSKEEALAE